MTQVIKLSRGAVWGSFGLYVLQSLFMLFAVLYFTILTGEPPLDPFDRLILFIGFIAFSYGAFGVYHLLRFAFGKRRRTELHFDETAISVQIAECEYTRFSAPDVQAFFPGRKEIQLTDGRRIILPSEAPHTTDNEIPMVLPWVKRGGPP